MRILVLLKYNNQHYGTRKWKECNKTFFHVNYTPFPHYWFKSLVPEKISWICTGKNYNKYSKWKSQSSIWECTAKFQYLRSLLGVFFFSFLSIFFGHLGIYFGTGKCCLCCARFLIAIGDLLLNFGYFSDSLFGFSFTVLYSFVECCKEKNFSLAIATAQNSLPIDFKFGWEYPILSVYKDLLTVELTRQSRIRLLSFL